MWNYLENNNNTVKYLDVTTNEAFSKDSKNLEIYLEFSLGFLGQSHVNNVFLSTYSRLPNKQCLLNIHGCLSLMIFFFHSRTVSGVFLPNFISSFLIKGEGSSKMSSQRQLLGPPRLFGRLEFLGHIQWDINDVHMMKKWNWKSIFRYLVKGSVQW